MVKSRFIIKTFFLLILIGCQVKSRSSSGDTFSQSEAKNDDGSYSDDTYCAEVQYHNPNTGTQSSYTLTIKVENNEIVKIDWPNGGSLGEDNFSNAAIDEDGHASFTSDKGYEYEVQIIGQSEGCFNNVPMAKQCIGKTKNSSRCRHLTDNLNQLCWQHQNQE
ncbi:hypothetical protein [Flavobacterium sp.]|uniref:hypothetical protein n=1 Tax=Flavobacterium sp. TaxID=239 RepID=UPI00374D5405